MLEGEGPHADETIVIGAHYDHLGRGEPGTLEPVRMKFTTGPTTTPRASPPCSKSLGNLPRARKSCRGGSCLSPSPAKSAVCLAVPITCKDPILPLDKTIAMLNMDMVGRLTDDKLIVYGNGTADRVGSICSIG